MSKEPSPDSLAQKHHDSEVFRFRTYEETELEREERRLARKLLRRRDNILKAAYLATERFLKMRPDESSIDPILERLGHATEVSRVYVFENHTDENETLLTSQRNEWVAPGIVPQLQSQNLQNVPFIEAGFQRWVDELSQGQLIYGHVSDFPETERELLAQQSILSIVVAPVFVGNKWWGFIGFDDCRTEREWSPVEIEALKIAGNILGAAIQRRQAEKALLDSERKYRLVVENANEGIVITQDQMIKFSNSKAREFAGIEEKAVPPRPLIDFIHPDDRQMVVNHHLKRLSGEESPEIYCFRVVKENGETLWLENNGVVIEWEGKPATLNFLMDITERKQAEDALRRSETQKQAILDATIDWIRHVDKDMRILWSNKTTGEGLKLPPEKIIGRTCHELFAGRDEPCESCPTLKARQTGKIERAVLDFANCTVFHGETFWDAYSVPLKNEAGEIDSFIQISRNITDQVRAMSALRESEEKYRQLFENESDAVMIFDAGTLRFEDANQATLGLFGYTKEEFLALAVVDISAEREKTRHSVKLIINDQPGSTRIPMRYFRRKDGAVFPGEISAGSFISGNHKKIIGAVRDITDRIQAEEKIHALTHEMIKVQENERHRIARYLHDHVAQDLSTLKLGCETLFGDQKEVTGQIKDKISELSKLLQSSITAVRDLSYELRPPGMDQLGLIRAVYQYCEDFSEKNDISVDFYSAGIEDVRLNFDTKINLFRLIQEGLNNIKKHAEADHVTIRLVASSPSIILRIEDNGKGFDVEGQLARSLKEKRMGLSSMEERVGLLGGSMRIQSRLSKGTKIFIEVPYPEKTHG